MSLASEKFQRKVNLRTQYIAAFKSTIYNTSDLDGEDAAAQENLLFSLCDKLASAAINEMYDWIKSSKSTVTTYGSATTQTSLPTPGVGVGVIIE